MKTTSEIYTLDLDFLDESASIASFLIASEDGLVLVESGPETTFEHLKKAVSLKGFDWKDVRHVLLTHIHFDHAGAAWKFAQNGAKIYVHPIGLPHLQHPEKLWHSAAMIYGDDMDRLWGKMEPIPEELLVAANDEATLHIGNLQFKVWYTPGHAVHHNAYQLGDVVFTGDVAGVRIHQGPVVPPCPPPDINIALWKQSVLKLASLKPRLLYLTHFGAVDEPQNHLKELTDILDDWANWMKPFYTSGEKPEAITPLFIEYTQNQLREKGVVEGDIQRYEYANPSWMSVSGLLRYWKLKEQGRI